MMFFEAIKPLTEGEVVQFLGAYVLEWRPTYHDMPTIGFRELCTVDDIAEALADDAFDKCNGPVPVQMDGGCDCKHCLERHRVRLVINELIKQKGETP